MRDMCPILDMLLSAVLPLFVIAGSASPLSPAQQEPASEFAQPETSDLGERLLELVARIPDFDTLGDPSSQTGRDLKVALKNGEDRLAAASAVLPIALDVQLDAPRRRDAYRLMSAILGRAKNDDDLARIVDDPELASQLDALRAALVADARTLLDEILADPNPGQRDESDLMSPRRGALRPDHLLPIELIALGHLGAGDDIVSLYDAAEAGMRRRTRERPDAPPIVSQLYWNTPFPLGTFVWPLGMAKSEAASGRLLRILEESERSGDLHSLQAVLDALQLVDDPPESLLGRVRSMIEAAYAPREVHLPEGTDPRIIHSQAWGDHYEFLRMACLRYLALGQKRFKATGDRTWLEPVFDWITATGNPREPEDLTTIRAGSADLALMGEITDPALQSIVVEAALPRLGTGSDVMRPRAFLYALAAMPKPTTGSGTDRRVTSAYAEALAGQFVRSKAAPDMLIAIRACGRWGRQPMLLDPVRDAFRTRIGATQAYAHLAGPAARAELEALRADGPFQGSLSEEERAERDRLLGMQSDSRDQTSERVIQQIEFWLRQKGLDDQSIAARRKPVAEAVTALFTDEAIQSHPLSKDYRNATAKALRAIAVAELGGEPSDFDSQFNDGFQYQLFMLHDLWIMSERQFGFDWNLGEALSILEISDQLAGGDATVARAGIAALRRRREDRIWEIGAFDIYAWVPELILMFEEAEARFGGDALAVRKDILSTLALFRSAIGRQFLTEVEGDPAIPDEFRQYAASLPRRPIKRLYDEAH